MPDYLLQLADKATRAGRKYPFGCSLLWQFKECAMNTYRTISPRKVLVAFCAMAVAVGTLTVT
ncbi:MAG: hypothetical protein OXH95_04140, partial [bacterium]|nr:hypothetical protein [bacterium]